MKRKIYLVEDEHEISDIIIKYLQREGYDVVPFYRGDNALGELIDNPPDLAILDIMLPELDGIEILKEVRKNRRTQALPVIFISAKRDEFDRILGIELGADDYVTKPFSFRELVGRVKALFRRIDYESRGHSQVDKNIVRSRTLTLDIDSKILSSVSSMTDLTFSEFSLLSMMMKRPGRVFTRDELQSCLSNGERVFHTRAIDIHVKNLRKKFQNLEVPTGLLQSIRGAGYKFED